MESSQILKNAIIFFVNGKKICENNVDPLTNLLTYLRERLRLTGAKMGCNGGGCGSCTVMISKYDNKTGRIMHYAVSACLLPVGTLHGLAVTTVEGIGSTRTKLHPVQERIAKSHGSQCGFCTPGFVMSMYALLRNNPEPSMEEIEENLVGNLCRCTGYRPILEGFRTFSKDYKEKRGCGRDDCCKLSNCNSVQENNEGSSLEKTPILFDPKMFTPYDPSQDIIFPSELKMKASSYLVSLNFSSPKETFFRVSSLKELLELKNVHNDAVIIVGSTKIGVDMNIHHKRYPKIIHPVGIPEMTEIRVSNSFFEFGAATSISDIETFIKENIIEIPESKAKVLFSIKEMLKYFADRQIKNVASVAGSIMTGFSDSDFNTILVASKTELVFQSVDSQRDVLFDEDFLINHLKDIINSKEVLVTIKIPLSAENEYFHFYKQSRRKGKDMAIVNAAIKVSFDFPTLKINDIIIALGSVKETTMMATKTMQSLRGQIWTEKVLEDATSFLIKEMKNLDIDVTCKSEYKIGLAASFFFKFYLFVCEELNKKFPASTIPLKEEEKLLTKPEKNIPTKSTQFFQNVPEDQEKIDPIGRPIPHVSALKQTTGEATYTDDIPRFENELQAALVLSEKSLARIVNIDPSEALKMKGVRGFFSAKDLTPEQNITGYLMKDEEVFASEKVCCVGQIIAVVVAETKDLAVEASRAVKVQYEDIGRPILSIEEAIKANSLWKPLLIETGNLNEGFQNSKHVLEGETRTGFQEHFYLETNAHIAVPYDNNEIHLIGTFQSPSQTQMIVSKALNLEANRVYCKVKRVGGGFGGKETRHLAMIISVALAAMKTGRPVRICLSRQDDMTLTGGRNPVLAKWKVGFEEDGKLNTLDIDYYLNAGYSLDLTDFVRKMIIMKANNVYHIENLRARGQSCKTNLPSNTAFRGFGTPQAIFIMESIIVKIAEFLRMDPNKVRERNMYGKSKSTTPYGQEIISNTVKQCWEQNLSDSNYIQRKIAVEKFNRKNAYKKRGISAMPIMFGIGFSLPFMHQAGALIMVYTDGSVLLSHGGVELGQGLHTKMLQIASRVLEIPIERIYISETSTDKVPNTMPTVASTASDLNGMAVLDACQIIKKRLEPYKSKMPEKSWNDWVQAAYMDRVSLSATGYHKTPDIIDYDFQNQIAGDPFIYFSFGSCVSEVEIDSLTGDHTVLRTDIIMDVGKSMNPAIDVGQIEGAFMQGYGLFTLEELVFSSSGELLTTGPDSYKIPDLLNIPREFNVTLLRDSVNERAVYSSKAIGEPPLVMGASVFLSIREAVKAARNEDILTIEFDPPATSERIRMACQDWITKKIAS